MANYWYLDSNVGTRASTSGTPYTSLQTGSFSALGAANVYASINDIYANTGTTFASGDYILVANNHSETVSATVTCGPDTDGGGIFNYLISVSSTNCDQYTPATSAQITITGVMQFRQSHIYGVYFSISGLNDIQFVTTVRAFNSLTDVTINITAGSNLPAIFTNSDELLLLLRNVEVIASGTSTNANFFSTSQIATVKMYNCKMTESGGTVRAIYRAVTNGLILYADGCDFSACEFIAYDTGGGATDSPIYITLHNCELQNAFTWLNETLIDVNNYCESYGCTDSTNDNPNAINILRYNGTAVSIIEDGTTQTVATGGTAMDMEATGEYMSLRVITNSNVGHHNPFLIELPVKFSGLETAASDTARIFLTSTTTLTDTDVVAEFVYRNATNVEQVSTAIGGEHNPIEAGTTLTSDASGRWANAQTNEYQIDIAATSGLDQPVGVLLTINVAATIYFDTEFDLV